MSNVVVLLGGGTQRKVFGSLRGLPSEGINLVLMGPQLVPGQLFYNKDWPIPRPVLPSDLSILQMLPTLIHPP